MLALACVSCGGDDEPDAPSLKGTHWSANLSAYANLVIEFPSENEVVGYHTNAAGEVSGSVCRGSYSFDGSRVVFSGFTLDGVMFQNFVDGTVAGSRMTLSYRWRMGDLSGEDSVSLRKS